MELPLPHQTGGGGIVPFDQLRQFDADQFSGAHNWPTVDIVEIDVGGSCEHDRCDGVVKGS